MHCMLQQLEIQVLEGSLYPSPQPPKKSVVLYKRKKKQRKISHSVTFTFANAIECNQKN